jgi:hypothetical protein
VDQSFENGGIPTFQTLSVPPPSGLMWWVPLISLMTSSLIIEAQTVSEMLGNFIVQCWMVEILHPPRKFERQLFCKGLCYGIKSCGIEVNFNGMTRLLNFIKMYRWYKFCRDRQTQRHDREEGDLISLLFL